MNILMLFSQPWKFGGAETYVKQLSERLVQRGHKLVLVTDEESAADDAVSGTVMHYKLLFRAKNPWSYFSTYQSLQRIITEHNIDIIHAQQRTAGYFAVLLEKKMGIPNVITLHDLWHRAPFKASHGKIFKHVIAVSEEMRQYYQRNFAADPASVVTIYNGVDETQFADQQALTKRASALRREFAIGPEEKVIALVGRVTKNKGHFDFLAAMEILRDQDVEFKALIVGDGPEKQLLQELVHDKMLGERVVFTGYQKDIPGIMHAADLIVLPSYREAFGLTLIEAMFAQKPVIGSAVGGIPEIVLHNHNGFLMEPGNSLQLALQIKTLVSDDKFRIKMGQVGYKRAVSRFALTKMVEETEKYYKTIIQQPKGQC